MDFRATKVFFNERSNDIKGVYTGKIKNKETNHCEP